MAKKILLAEDSVTMQKVVEMTFAAEDATVEAVSSGDEAIQKAKEIKPDIVIADLSMEGKNGYDVCEALKADPALKAIPVLLLHGSAAPLDEAKASSVQSAGEIQKPFDTQALIDKVNELAVEGKPAAREAMGPVESLSSPLTGGLPPVKPEKPAAPPAPKPAAKPPMPKPAAAPPPPKPAAAPPTPKPAAAPPRPSIPAKPSAPAPSAPPPRPAAPPPAAAAPKPAPREVEITIEAEPPPAQQAPDFDASAFETGRGARPVPPLTVEPSKPAKPGATLLGVGDRPAAQPPGPASAPEAPPPVRPGEPYEAAIHEEVSRISREVIEKVVWEVVPALAEKIIREELDRLVEKRRSS